MFLDYTAFPQGPCSSFAVQAVLRAEIFAKAVDIADEIDPGIRSEILTGKIKPTQNDVEILAKANPEERAALVEDLRKPPEERRKVLPERHLLTLEQIAAELPSEDCRGTPESMLYELEDALDTFIFRWSVFTTKTPVRTHYR